METVTLGGADSCVAIEAETRRKETTRESSGRVGVRSRREAFWGVSALNAMSAAAEADVPPSASTAAALAELSRRRTGDDDARGGAKPKVATPAVSDTGDTPH